MKYPDDFAISIRTGTIAVLAGLFTHFSGVMELLQEWGININPEVLAIAVWSWATVGIHHLWQKMERIPTVGPVLSKVISLWTASTRPQIAPPLVDVESQTENS